MIRSFDTDVTYIIEMSQPTSQNIKYLQWHMLQLALDIYRM